MKKLFIFFLMNFNLEIKTVFGSNNSTLPVKPALRRSVAIFPDRLLIKHVVSVTRSLAADGFINATDMENIIKTLINFFQLLKYANRSENEENHIRDLFNQLFNPYILPNANRLVLAGLLQHQAPEFSQYEEEMQKIIPDYQTETTGLLLEYLTLKIQEHGVLGENVQTLCGQLESLFKKDLSPRNFQILEFKILDFVSFYRLLSFGFSSCPFISNILKRYESIDKNTLHHVIYNLKELEKTMNNLIQSFRKCHKELKKTIKGIFNTKEIKDPSKLLELQTQRNKLAQEIEGVERGIDNLISQINAKIPNIPFQGAILNPP